MSNNNFKLSKTVSNNFKLSKTVSKLIVISAPSGAGKTTLCEKLLRDFPNISLSISTTTRPIRPKEKNGVHYRFVTREEFLRKIAKGDFAEWAVVHGNHYGTDRHFLESTLAKGLHVLFDIDVQGAMNLKKIYANRVLLIFIYPPSLDELRKRLIKRKSDSESTIETRIKNAYNELRWSTTFDHQIINDSLDRAYQELRNLVMKECG